MPSNVFFAIHFKQLDSSQIVAIASSLRGRYSGLYLPAAHKTHVLRHTFASHFIMNGGNVLTLQKVLGHASLNMTMRYMHLAPDFLKDVISLGPIKDFRHFFDTEG
ncbi:MAG: integrase [Pseudomonadaceae bacterium]|nr:integrase [Pseudomonadaceae bacterium]